MNSLELGMRVSRHLKEKDFSLLAAVDRIEILDAINAALQRMYHVAPPHLKNTRGAAYLAAPLTISIGVTQGSAEFTGFMATTDHLGCTVRIEGDAIDNQIVSNNEFLHPYAGPAGTVNATIYSDAIQFYEPVASILGEPMILETRSFLIQDKEGRNISYGMLRSAERRIGRPEFYWMEPNAANQSPPASFLLRTDTLPDIAYRLTFGVELAPVRFVFQDMIVAKDIPMPEQSVESYLLPIVLGPLTYSSLWRDSKIAADIRTAANNALAEYAMLTPTTMSTPNNQCYSPRGY